LLQEGVAMNNISENLKKLRVERGLKQEQIAEFLGTNRTTYTHFENGRDPDVKYLLRLADMYNISLDELVGRKFQDEESYNERNEIEHEDYNVINKRLLLKALLKNSSTEDTLLFMLYQLKTIDAEKVQYSTEEAIKLIMRFVIKNIYLKMNDNSLNIGRDSHKLSLDVSKKIFQLGDEIFSVLEVNQLKTNNTILTEKEILDTEEIKKYFKIDIENILRK
jgi:transcriptional regulator with XRE-family HTH domain